MPFLERVKVRGYRSLRDVELELGPVTVLIGANGAGKSNLLDFLRMLMEARSGSLEQFVFRKGGANSLLHRGARATPSLDFELAFESSDATSEIWSATLEVTDGDGLFFRREDLMRRSPLSEEIFELGAGARSALRRTVRADDPTHVARKAMVDRLWRMRFLHVHDTSSTAAIRLSARKDADRGLAEDAGNLAAILHSLRHGQDPDAQAAWERIGSIARIVAPFLSELDPNSTELRPNPRLDWVDTEGSQFGPHQLSDGTLRILALITMFAQPRATLPAFVAIDEPEIGLHPVAIRVLVELIRSVAGHCQVVLATQSPWLLDHFEPEEVVVVEQHTGESKFRRISATDLAGWLDEYRLSDLFDKNVLGGQP